MPVEVLHSIWQGLDPGDRVQKWFEKAQISTFTQLFEWSVKQLRRYNVPQPSMKYDQSLVAEHIQEKNQIKTGNEHERRNMPLSRNSLIRKHQDSRRRNRGAFEIAKV